MANFIPFDGKLAPRSRLSSLNTIRTLSGVRGITPHYVANSPGNSTLWISDTTIHGLLQSNGSISRASFVSAFGLGIAGIASFDRWQYTTAYAANLSENMVIAAGGLASYGTLQAIYQTGGSATGVPLYSYLTSAPQARCVGSFDNYVLAWNTKETNALVSRLRWSVRGDPSNWTSEGSGFEDLLSMKGAGTRVIGTADQRFILFSDLEIWYGVPAPYPQQFQFAPLDQAVGCIAPNTVVETEAGIVFLGTDLALRVLPRGGGLSQIISASISEHIQNYGTILANNYSYGVYDPIRKLYYLYLDTFQSGTLRGFVLNVVTGEWGFVEHNTPTPVCGVAFRAPLSSNFVGNVFFGSSTGTAYSLNSLVAQENGSNVTSFVRLPIAPDLAGNYKQLTKAALDYRATSKSTVTLKVSQDGGNNYESTGRVMSLASAPASGRVESDLYIGGAFPAIELNSQSTGYELHRLDVSMDINGRK